MVRIHAMRFGRPGSIPAVIVLALASLASAPASPVHAAEVIRVSHAELAKQAELIVQGKVKTTQPRAGQGSAIYTDVTLEVTAWIKSGDAAQKTFTFSTMGGTLDGRTFGFSGNTKYAEGEEVLLFLGAPEPRTGWRSTIGVAQGKFTIKKEESGKAYLERDLGGTTFVDGRGSGGAAKDPEQGNVRLYLDDFLKEIKGYLEKK